jgi:hypothetical protein
MFARLLILFDVIVSYAVFWWIVLASIFMIDYFDPSSLRARL